MPVNCYQMNRNETFGIYNTTEHISLLKYSKTACGVDFLLNTAESWEKRGWFDTDKRYKTDTFEFFFFRKAEGYLFLGVKELICILIWCSSLLPSNFKNGMWMWTNWNTRS